MYLNDYEKGWPFFCPFKPYWKVQCNIAGISEQFFIRLCIKKMKTQETFMKKSGLTPVPRVRNYCLISSLLTQGKYVPQWLWQRLAIFLSIQTFQESLEQYSCLFEQFSVRLCVKIWKRRKPSWKNTAIHLSNVWETISLSLLFWNKANMYLNDYEKGWLFFCPFKPNWKSCCRFE